MDQLLNEMQRFDSTITGAFTIWEALTTLMMTFVLSLAITWTYRHTHRGISYSQSFVHTTIIMAVVVSLIMLIIGSNIARAFSLVGALSIVRFRQAIKDTRDIAFIFLAMAVGMACGTRFYLLALIATTMILAMIHILFVTNYGSRQVMEKIVRIVVPTSKDYQHLFTAVFNDFTSYFALVSVEPQRATELLELVYLVRLKQGTSEASFIESVKKLNDNNRVTVLFGQQSIDL